MYVRAEGRFYDMPAAKTEKIVNTVGAGDCLFSTFISMYAKGELPSAECLELAQKAAAHKIGFDGAAEGFMSLKDVRSLNGSVYCNWKWVKMTKNEEADLNIIHENSIIERKNQKIH